MITWVVNHSGKPLAPQNDRQKICRGRSTLEGRHFRHAHTPWADLAQDTINRGFSVKFNEEVHSAKYYERRSLFPSIDRLTFASRNAAILLRLFRGSWLIRANWWCRCGALSLVAATLVLMAMGATINTMVLAGLVIAMGEVVDDAIIDVENIVRRLRLNRASARPLSAFRVVLAASLEVRSAVVYASLIVILVFMPVFFLEGLAGLVLPAAGPGLRAGDRGLAAGRPDGHAGPVADAPDRRDRAAARVAAGAGSQGDLPRDPAAAGAPARAGPSSSLVAAFAARAGPSSGWARSSCPTSRRTTS